ncbi:hypothetical protein GGTG_08032 [Gaeumannomyces tritici R3-111a-1]|uniref:Uncharacterized protein n=1 Tax=Gaeumannomyces tritici (strain R3-111a-1) TaxID=644352 RepID=J3P3E5_GAET3|nr:hypothetical protein GGTG_08032 [Gaeumannomyces tritici R3-111a-1]EJT74187.1 hypothetical protein GGTG_08032 [Gaeumannomyces tritici R3-111a-1]
MKLLAVLTAALSVAGLAVAQQNCRQLNEQYCECSGYCYLTRDGGCSPPLRWVGLCPL